MAPRTLAFRRARHVVLYWRESELIACDYLRRVEVTVAPVLVDILHRLGDWRSIRGLESFLPGVPRYLLREAIGRLVEMGLVRRSDSPTVSTDRRFKAWQPWAPEAAFFHFATKNLQYAPNSELAPATGKAPPPVKRYPRRPRVRLQPADIRGDFPRILRDRRTWRRFGPEVLSLQDVSTLLGLTWGVQHWMTVPGDARRMALKTSPSGGARHSIEAYLLAQRVEDVPSGVYHYAPNEHVLARVKHGAGARQVAGYLPAQPGFSDAAAVIIMTSVFERMLVRYPYPKAYRAVLAEAGHLAQTFCLVATWLGLAPFCTMAFADALIEKDLKIDGISESVIYVAGVGRRPAEASWAPWPDASQPLPRRSSPAYNRVALQAAAKPINNAPRGRGNGR